MKLLPTFHRGINAWLIASLITGVPTNPVLARTYYVSVQDGVDLRTPELAQDPLTPWASLTRALSEETLAPGDIIRVAPGVYTDEVIQGVVPTNAYETFPLELVDGVAILGTGADTIVAGTTNVPLFHGAGNLGPDTWLGDLTLTGELDAAIHLNSQDAVQEPRFDNLFFETFGAGIRGELTDGTGVFAPMITGSTFTGLAYALDFSAAGYDQLTFAPVVDGNTLRCNVGVHFQASENSADTGTIISPVLVGNGLGSDYVAEGNPETLLQIYPHNLSGPITIAPVVVGNTVSNLNSSAVDLSVYSMNFSSSGSLELGLTVAENVISSVSGDVARVNISGVPGGEITGELLLSGNTIVNADSGLAFSMTSVNTATVSLGMQVAANNAYIEDDLLQIYDANMAEGTSSYHLTVAGNTARGYGSLVSVYGSSMLTMDRSVELEVTDNDFESDESSFLDLDQYRMYLTHSGTSLLAANNTFSAGYGGVDISYYSASTGSIDLDAQILGNTFHLGDGGEVVELDLGNQDLQDISAAVSLLGNTITGASAGYSLDAYTLYDSDLEVVSGVFANTFSGLDGLAVEVSVYGGDGLTVDLPTTVSGNTLAGAGEGVMLGVYDMSSAAIQTDLIMMDNSFSNVEEEAIMIEHGDNYLTTTDSSALIANNTFHSVGTAYTNYGYSMSSAVFGESIALISNEVEAVTDSGFVHELYYASGGFDTDLLIAGNTITGSDGDGMFLSMSEMYTGNATLDLDWVVSNNTVRGASGTGIYVELSSMSSVSEGNVDVTLAGNEISQAAASGLYFYTDYWDAADVGFNLLVAGNTTTESGYSGISVSVSSGNQLSSPRVEVRDNVTTGNYGDGIYVYQRYQNAQPTVLIAGNTATGNVFAGVEIDTDDPTPAEVDMGGGTLGSPGLNSVAHNGVAGVYAYGLAGVVSATDNYWGTTDLDAIAALAMDVSEGLGGAVVDFSDPLSAAPQVAATASLSGAVTSDTGLPGSSQGDTVHLTATLVGTGDVGCAAARFTADTPAGATFVQGSLVTSKGTILAIDEVDAGIQWLAAGETVTVEWDLTIPYDTQCGDIAVQGALRCYQLGTVLTDDPAGEGSEDATSIAVAMQTFYTDADGDGHGDAAAPVTTCETETPEGTVASADDCDDSDDTVYAGAEEVCDDQDNDCDESTDEGLIQTWYADGDGDGRGDAAVTVDTCETPAGYVTGDDTDCDDGREDVYPGATETCDDVDNDCDEDVDEDGLTTFYADEDDDGYGDAGTSELSCGLPAGYVLNDFDCDDGDDGVHPGASETCNDADDDCDGNTDEGGEVYSYLDDDGDGFGDPNEVTAGCDVSGDYVSNADDCDDGDEDVNPDANERCNGDDDDCDGATDEDVTTTYYTDDDEDGFGDALESAVACSAPEGYVEDGTDCDDTSDAVNPDATEVCDGIDNDCNGRSDEDLTQVWYADADADTYGDASTAVADCQQPSGYIADASDCDDTDAAVNPAGTEVCNGSDDDCNGVVDDSDECTATSTPDVVDGGGGGGCDTSGGAGGGSWLSLLLIGLYLGRRRRSDP